MCIGAADDSLNQWVVAIQDENGQTSSDTGRIGASDECILFLDQTGAIDGEANISSFGVGSVTVNWGNLPASAWLITVVLFAVDNAEAGTFDPSDSIGGTVTITPSFQSTLIFGAQQRNLFDDTHRDSAAIGFGVCDENLNQGSHSWNSANATGSTQATYRVRNDAFLDDVTDDLWLEITSITATQFVVTTRNATRAALRVGYLALDTGDRNTFIDNVAIPNSTGDNDYNVGFASQIAGFCLGLAEADNTIYTNSLANGYGVSAFTENDEYTQLSTLEDGAGTTVTDSLSDNQAVAVQNLPATLDIEGTWSAFDTPNVTINFSNVAANVKRTVIWAIEAEAAPTPPVVVVAVADTTPTHWQSKELTVNFSDPLWFTDRRALQYLDFSTYAHELRAIGGYYSLKLTIDDDELDLNDWIDGGIGRHIVSYNPELEVIGEYFVNKVTATIGALQFSIGPLIAIGNRLKVRYSVVDTTVDPPIRGEQTETAIANNTDSQALFGIIESVLNVNSATATEATQIRDSVLNDVSRAFPATGRKSTLGGSNPRLTLDCLGYWHWLNTYLYNNSATGQVNLSDKIIAILAAIPNSGIFSTLTDEIASNTTQVQDGEDKDKKAITIMKYLNSLGDSANNRYNMGFYQDRKFRYGVAPSEVEYHQRITGDQDITTPTGSKVSPWNVLPAKWLFFPDFLVGRHPPISNSTQGWLY
jgi:hypothetical protein